MIRNIYAEISEIVTLVSNSDYVIVIGYKNRRGGYRHVMCVPCDEEKIDRFKVGAKVKVTVDLDEDKPKT